MKLGTIEYEAALCRAAFEGSNIGDLAWCVHHEILCEPLTEPAESRIRYILAHKPKRERAHRLHEMRPVRGSVPEEWAAARKQLSAARGQYAAAHEQYTAAREQLDAAREQWAAACEQWDAACEQWAAAHEQYTAAHEQLDAACEQWAAACEQYKPALEALHAVECPDSAWNGTTIFPKEEAR